MRRALKATICNEAHPEYGAVSLPFPIKLEEYDENLKMLDTLKSLGVIPPEVKGAESDILDGKTFVLTGTLKNMTRDEAGALIKKMGGKTSSSVSKNTSFVLAGENPGSKLDKAEKLGVIILTEDEFFDMINK